MSNSVWYKIDGEDEADRVKVDENAEIVDLKSAIIGDNPKLLSSVDRRCILLFPHGAETNNNELRVNPGLPVPTDTTCSTPLLVKVIFPHQQQEQPYETMSDHLDPFKTPHIDARPTKRQRLAAMSPGAMIEKLVRESDGETTYLAGVMNVCFKDSNVTVPPAENYAYSMNSENLKELGEFQKKDLVHTRGQIDGRFRECMTYAGEELEKFLRDERNHQDMNAILLGKSGVGKTTAIFDAAAKLYCVYFSSSHHRSDISFGDPGQFDKSFSQMVEDIEIILFEQKSRYVGLPSLPESDRINHTIRAMVVARMLVMYKFQTLPGATPKLWMHYQLTPEIHQITLKVYGMLNNTAADRITVVKRLAKQVASDLGTKWFFAYDEAQYGFEILKGKGPEDWNSRKTDGDTLGVGSPFLKVLADLGPSVIAGTALSLNVAEIVISSSGKERTCKLFTDFPSVTLEEIRTELQETLNLDDVNLEEIPLWMLEGRGRLLGNLYSSLREIVETHRNGAKQMQLLAAVEDHYNCMLCDIREKVETLWPMAVRSIVDKTPDLPGSLRTVAIASLWGGTVGIGAKNIDIDLLDIGLCSVRMEKTPRSKDEKVFILDEEISKKAILQHADNFGFTSEIFGTTVEVNEAAKGHAMETVVVLALKQWCRKSEGQKTVREFLAHLFPTLPDDLPKWIDTEMFEVKGACGKERGLVHSPSTIKRPDFESIMGACDTGWFLAMSSKLYQRTYDDKFGYDLLSTNPRKGFYRKKDGKENKKCHRLRGEWEAVLKSHDAVFRKCLRLHFCLPDVIAANKKSERIWRDDDDSIVAYITSNNARKIFDPKTIQILEKLGGLNSTVAE